MRLKNVVALDGIDGCGKTYQVSAVADKLKALGVDVVTYKYPTDEFCGKQIRELLKDKDVSQRAVQLLFEADKILADSHLRELSEEHSLVLLDRHSVVNLAYGLARGFDLQWLSSLQKGYAKSRTLYIDIPPAVGSNRRKGSGMVESIYDVDLDFLKLAREKFWMLVSISDRIDGNDEKDKITDSIISWLKSNHLISI